MPTGRHFILAGLLAATAAAVAVSWVNRTGGTSRSDAPDPSKVPNSTLKPEVMKRLEKLAEEHAPKGDSLEEMRKPARAVAAPQPPNPVPDNYMPGGLMFVDTLAFTGKGVRGTYNTEAVLDSNGTLEVVGWAIDTVQKNSGEAVQIVFASEKTIKVLSTVRDERVDVANQFNGDGYRYSGFSAKTDIASFEPGEYRMFIRVVCMENAGVQQHDTQRRVSIVLPSKPEDEF